MVSQRRLGNSSLYIKNIIAVAFACTLLKSSCVAGGSVGQRYCSNSPLNGVTFKAECILNGLPVPCNDRIKPGTTAKINCSPNYEPRDNAIQIVMCQEDGLWDYNPTGCIQKCGEASEQVHQMTNTTLMPWHVGIYQNKAGTHTYSCGGTIINANLVITVAHCLWDEAKYSINDRSSFIIGAGKLNRNANESNAQFRNISQISVHPLYSGSAGNFKNDIAVIVLSDPLLFSALIAPVCIQWESDGVKDFSNNLIGSVVIWGTGQSELKTVSLPGSSYAVCQEEATDQSSPFLSSDKFCVLNRSNEIPCVGDSGSGFVVKKLANGEMRHFLMGLVSIGWPSPQNNNCNKVRFIGMTNIQFYEKWIVNLLNSYRPK